MSHATMLEWLGNIPGNDLSLPMLIDQMQTPVGVVPFIGAGMSAPCGVRPWTLFLSDAAKLAGKTRAIDERVAAGRYEEAAEILVLALTPSGFQDLIESYFGDRVLDGKDLTGAITLIPRLSSGPVITTNFDRVLERVFQHEGCPFETVVWHSKLNLAVRALERNGTVLLKLHGDWEDPDHRVLTLSEYKQNYGDAEAAINFDLPLPQLFKLLAVRPLLFLGCNLNEDRTLKILKRVAADVKTSRHYAVVQKPKGAAKFRARMQFLATHNIRPIWYPEGEHHRIERLLEYLSEQIPEAYRRKTQTRPDDGTAKAASGAETIPRPLTKFFGRETELKELCELAKEAGLVTIAGGPGAGKTRVAIELARSLAPEFQAAWFVELSQLAEAQLVPQRVAAALGIREPARRPPTESLAEFLRQRKYLVLLDNCEHVRQACTDLADDLLRRCPKLTIVATSREVLRVAGEQVYQLPPLDLPDPERLPELSELKRIDSVKLFLDRASRALQNARPGEGAGLEFELTVQNARDVATLCRELEGMPLAIELAAAQLSSLSVQQILRHMDERLKLLTGGIGGTEERQWATLREAIQFSYDRLEPEQKLLFRRLAVFGRGCTWDAAAEICGPEGQDRFAVLRLLNELNARSLLWIEDGREEKRFRMLNSIREFASGELEASGERMQIDEKHAAWFATLAERAAPELLKRDQARWLDLLGEDVDNLRGAILWSVKNERAETALRLVAALWRLMEIRGYLREGRERLETALAMRGTDQYPALRSKALSGVGMLAYRQGDMESAGRYFAESLEIERARKDAAGIANALNDLGNVADWEGDVEKAHDYYVESLDLERETKNARGVAVALYNLGECARRLGRLDEAEDLYGKSRQGFEAEGNLREAAFPLNGLGRVALARGRYEDAIAHAERSLNIRRELSDKTGMADTLRTLGAVRLKQGNCSGALELLSESLELARGVEDKRGIAETVEQFASAAAVQKEFVTATTLYAAAQQIREETMVQLVPIERAQRDAELEEACTALGQAEFEKRQAEGRELTLAAVIETANSVPGRAMGSSSET